MKTIKYICYYALPDKHPSRNFVLAATNKITYICSALGECDFNVELISASASNAKAPGEVCKVSDNTTLRLFPSLGTGRKVKRVLSRWLMMLQFFCYLLFHTKKDENVIVYHSLGYANMIRLLKKMKRFRLILEVEEIYSDVTGNEKTRSHEMKLFGCADAFLFPTELLNKKLNADGRPAVIIHGTYHVELQRSDCKFEFDPLHEKIHLLYAGTFDPRKGGAIAAAAAADFLPSDYHIHIIGFGSDADKKFLQDTIDHLSSENHAIVTMDGLKSGEDYIRFVQSCDVGFSTQSPGAAFNDTSFPSKVLSYMANGLRVVSVRIPALEHSAIDDLLSYYDGNDPKAIAKAVMEIDRSTPYDSRSRIQDLHERFVEEIGGMLNESISKGETIK